MQETEQKADGPEQFPTTAPKPHGGVTTEKEAAEFDYTKNAGQISDRSHAKEEPTMPPPFVPCRQPPQLTNDGTGNYFLSAYAKTAQRIGNESKRKKTPLGRTGLSNMGNTCFMNAILQPLFHTPGFSQLFREKNAQQFVNGTKGTIAGAFSALIDQIWSSKFNAILPKVFMEFFDGHVNAELANGQQHDAHEFLIYLLAALHEDTNRVENRQSFDQNYDGTDLGANASDFFEKSKLFSSSPVNDLFNLTTISVIKCITCNASSVRFESVNQLSIELSTNFDCLKLKDCIEAHFSSTPATRSTKIWKIPEILIVHLKRFSQNDGNFVKNEVEVTFNVNELNLSPYIHEMSPLPNSAFTLYAMTNHSGSLNIGHYTSAVVNLTSTDQQWLSFNDDSCIPCAAPSPSSQSAFLLYYKLTNSTNSQANSKGEDNENDDDDDDQTEIEQFNRELTEICQMLREHYRNEVSKVGRICAQISEGIGQALAIQQRVPNPDEVQQHGENNARDNINKNSSNEGISSSKGSNCDNANVKCESNAWWQQQFHEIQQALDNDADDEGISSGESSDNGTNENDNKSDNDMESDGKSGDKTNESDDDPIESEGDSNESDGESDDDSNESDGENDDPTVEHPLLAARRALRRLKLLTILDICAATDTQVREYGTKLSAIVKQIAKLRVQNGGALTSELELRSRQKQAQELLQQIGNLMPQLVVEEEEVTAILKFVEQIAFRFSIGFRDREQQKQFIKTIRKAKKAFEVLLKHNLDSLVEQFYEDCYKKLLRVANEIREPAKLFERLMSNLALVRVIGQNIRLEMVESEYTRIECIRVVNVILHVRNIVDAVQYLVEEAQSKLKIPMKAGTNQKQASLLDKLKAEFFGQPFEIKRFVFVLPTNIFFDGFGKVHATVEQTLAEQSSKNAEVAEAFALIKKRRTQMGSSENVGTTDAEGVEQKQHLLQTLTSTRAARPLLVEAKAQLHDIATTTLLGNTLKNDTGYLETYLVQLLFELECVEKLMQSNESLSEVEKEEIDLCWSSFDAKMRFFDSSWVEMIWRFTKDIKDFAKIQPPYAQNEHLAAFFEMNAFANNDLMKYFEVCINIYKLLFLDAFDLLEEHATKIRSRQHIITLQKKFKAIVLKLRKYKSLWKMESFNFTEHDEDYISKLVAENLAKHAKHRIEEGEKKLKDAAELAKKAAISAQNLGLPIVEHINGYIDAINRAQKKLECLTKKEVYSDVDQHDQQLSFEQLVEKIMEDGGFYATTECMEREKLNKHNANLREWLMQSYNEFLKESAEFEQFDAEDISDWWKASANKSEEKAVNQNLALVAKSVEVIAGHKPRNTQLLAIFLRMFVKIFCPEMRGLMLQVSTGEGKSWIVAMLVVILHTFGKKEEPTDQKDDQEKEKHGHGESVTDHTEEEMPDQQGKLVAVITSNKHLAVKDAEHMVPFFTLFGLTVAHISHDDLNEQILKKAYESDVIYGTMQDFHLHESSDEIYGTKYQSGREIDDLINDEGDFSKNDDVTHERELRLAFNSPGMENLNDQFLLLTKVSLSLALKALKDAGQIIGKDGPTKEQETALKQYLASFLRWNVEQSSKARSNKRKQTVTNADEEEGEESSEMPMPQISKHLEEFTELELEGWVNSALQSLSLSEQVQYIKQVEELDNRMNASNGSGGIGKMLQMSAPMRIVPVDNMNSGIIEKNSQFSNGLHQCVQTLQDVELTPPSLQCSHKNNLGFFLSKKFDITSITGTSGNTDERAFTGNTFNLMNITLPRFKERKYTKDGDKLCKSREEWLESIREKAMEYSEKRAVLIITISIKDAKEIEAKIKADPKIAETRQIRMFTQGTEEECKMLREDMCIGHILIGTLQIARGVDENPSSDVLANGGLAHLTVFPECNQRVDEQAAGRVARKDQPGSGCSIIYESQVRTLLGVAGDEQWTDEEWSNWRIRRDEMVAAQLEFFRLNRIPPIMLNDALYQRMCRRIPEIRAMCDKAGNKCLYAFTQILEAWSFWNNKIEYEINKKIAEAQKEGKSVKWAVQEWEEHFFKLFDAFIAAEIDKLRKFIDKSENVELFRNPAYLINAGHHQLETKDFDIAEKMYSKADQLDPEFGGIALYYLAQTYIEQSFKLFKKENERTNKNDKLQEQAHKCLTKAAELAKERIAQINNILTMSGTSGMKADGRISRQYHRKTELINSFMHQCNTSIGTIDRSNDPKYKGSAVVKVTKRQAVDEGLRKYRKHVKEQQAEEKKQKEKKPAPNTTNDVAGGNSTGNNHNGSRPASAGGPDDPSPDEPVSNASAGAAPAGDDVSIPREEIKEMKNAGLGHFYELDIALPKPPWWTIGLLFIFGVAQTFFGACLFASGIGSAWGSSIMQGGWDDLKQSIIMAYEALTDKMSQAFSWGKWLGQKCVHYGKALLGYLFKQLLKICPKLDKFVKKINDFFNGKKPIDVKDGLSVGEAVPTPKMSLGEVVKQHVTMHVKKELTSVSNITRLHAATLPEGHSIRKFYEKNSTLIQHIDVFCSSVNSGKDLDLLAMAGTHTKLLVGSALRKSQKPPKDGSRPTFKHDFWSTVKTETWNSCVDFAVDKSINCTVVMIKRDIERRNERRMKKSPMPVPLFLPSSVYYNNSKRNNAEQQPSSAANGNTASAFSGPPPARETPAAGAADTQRVNGNGKNKLDKKRMNNRARAFINEPKSKNTKKRANERTAENANKSTVHQIKKKAEEPKMKKMAEEKTKIANAMLFTTEGARDAVYSSIGGLKAQLFNCINGNGDIPTAEADPHSSPVCADPNSASANGNNESAHSEPPAPAEERASGQTFPFAGSSYHGRFGQPTHGLFGQPTHGLFGQPTHGLFGQPTYPFLNPMMPLSPEVPLFLTPYVCNVEHQSSSADPGHKFQKYNKIFIDVSHHQGKINWTRVTKGNPHLWDKENEIIAISKATQGSRFVDHRFFTNFKEMKEAGISTRGAYHFFEGAPKSASAKAQAEHFFSTLKKAGFDKDKDFIVVDVEKDCNKGAVKSAFSEKLVELVKLMKEKMPTTTLYIYTNKDGWNNLVDTKHDDFFGQFPLWVAHYAPNWEHAEPKKPRPWANKKAEFRQYSEDGTVNGIAQKVDMNVIIR
ncbi:hypothetical protein niasHT_002527 [Heterodera trifolii]|uniref:ubiquitinyl hydrolase 1 n=1 Tax=Heterodera trifolii TaxID=157864 RepID=A0ABD2LYW9_9BILA